MAPPQPLSRRTTARWRSPAPACSSLLACAAFYFAAGATRTARAATGEIAVTIDRARPASPTSSPCPAGRRTFRIVNPSDRPLEWEILDGVMVVAERENIAPGINSDAHRQADARQLRRSPAASSPTRAARSP